MDLIELQINCKALASIKKQLAAKQGDEPFDS